MSLTCLILQTANFFLPLKKEFCILARITLSFLAKMADVRREGQLFTLCLLAIHVTVNIISKEWQYLKGYNDVGIIYIDLTAYGHPKGKVIVFWCLFAHFLLFLPLACSTRWHRKKRYPYWKRPFQAGRHFFTFLHFYAGKHIKFSNQCWLSRKCVWKSR